MRNLRKIQHIQGMASFRDARTLDIDKVDGSKETLTFEHCIIATGSVPTRIPGLSIDSPRLMDSTGALDLPDVPKSLLVVGGGYIGLELGSVYAALGSKVTVVEMTGGLLPGADRDLVSILAKRIEQICEAVWLNTKVTGMKEAKDGIAVTFEGEGKDGEQTFDRVLVSIGRRPNAKIPGLDKTEVKVDPRGLHRHRPQPPHRRAEHLRHRRRRRRADARAQGVARGARRRGRDRRRRNVEFEPAAIPAVVFTDPEIAWAGLTETDAEKQGIKVDDREVPVGRLGPRDRARPHRRRDEARSSIRRPSACSASASCGPGAGELIAEGVLAIEMGATAQDLAHDHPPASDAV